MRWANNNPLKMNEYITLFFRNSLFADLQTLFTFHFEVKFYKYVVLGWKECLGVFNRIIGVILFGGLIFRIGITYGSTLVQQLGVHIGVHIGVYKPYNWL